MLLRRTLRKATELGFALTAVATMILAGCGGGGSSTTTGGGSSTPAATTSASITPFKGPFYSGATVTLKDANGNPVALTSGGTINANGVASVTYNANVTYPLIVEVTGSYYNEITKATESTTVPIRSLIQNATEAAAGVPVTIVTETAVADLETRLGSFAASHPIQAASAVAALSAAGTMLGVPASAVPAFNPTTNQTSDANTLRLAAWAIAANGQTGATLAEKVKALANGLVNPANTPSTLISQAAYNQALASVTSGASSVLAAGASVPAPHTIPTTNYASLYASAGGNNSGGGTGGTGGTGGGSTGTGGGSTGTPPPGTLFVTNAPSYVGDFTPTVTAQGSGGTGGISLTSISWEEPHIPNVVIEQLHMTFHLSGTASPVGTPSTIEYWAADATSSVPAVLINCNATPAQCAGVVHDNVARTVTFTNFVISTVTLNGTLSYLPAPPVVVAVNPTVSGFTPSTGALGTVVTITGTNLNKFTNTTPGPWVSFGNVAAISTLVDNQTVTAIVPASLPAGSTTISLSNSNGTGLLTVGSFTVTAAPPPPTITGFAPVAGPAGTTVTITGTNLSSFVSAPVVKFGTTIATSTLVDNQTITATVPSGLQVGNSTISVANGDGTGTLTAGIFSFGPSVTTLAGSGTRGIPPANGTGAAATFNGPTGLVATGGNLYVTDGTVIRKIEISTGVVTTFAGSAAYGTLDGVGAAAKFSTLQGITTDGNNLYVSELTNVIRKVEIATGVVTTLAGTPNNFGGYADGTGAAAAFYGASDLTYFNGNLYVVEVYNHVVRKIDVATGGVTTLAGAAGNLGSYADGVGAAARFNQPIRITHDANNLYVADASNRMIRKIDPASGAVTTFAVIDAAQGLHYDLTCQCMYMIVGHGVSQIDLATAAVTRIAGNSLGLDDGAALTTARFNTPKYITGDSSGLYVSDWGNYKIRMIHQ